MVKASYEVRHQGSLYAVLRRGPRGGTRLINVYRSSDIAEEVAHKLRRFLAWEA